MKRKSYKYPQRLTFYKFHWPVMRKFKLSPTEALLMALVDGLSKKKGFCFSSEERMAEQLNVSRQTVHHNLRKLKQKGLIWEDWLDEYDAKTRQPSDVWRKFLESLVPGTKDYLHELEDDGL